jgi:hypothetical protein
MSIVTIRALLQQLNEHGTMKKEQKSWEEELESHQYQLLVKSVVPPVIEKKPKVIKASDLQAYSSMVEIKLKLSKI